MFFLHAEILKYGLPEFEDEALLVTTIWGCRGAWSHECRAYREYREYHVKLLDMYIRDRKAVREKEP